LSVLTELERDPDRVLAMAQRRDPIPRGWHDLGWISMTDRRDAIRIYERQHLHPIALHGLVGDRCTCGRFPCGEENRSAGKHPVFPGWQKAPLDLGTLDAMLVSNWRYNIGLRTGPQPNGRFLVVVDVDGPRSLLEPLEREHGAFPETLTARTGSGGMHLFYWTRPGVEMGNRAGVVPHVDVRGRGGQVVAAPSVHRSGNRYEWLDVREPAVLP
jgi:putative DNA primase/helicase